MSCAPTRRALRPSFPESFAGWGYLELALDGCAKSLVFETTTSCKLPHELPGNLKPIDEQVFSVLWTESGPKSIDHAKQSLETEKIMFLYWRQKLYKMRMELNFWLTVSTNGELTRLCYKCKVFYFFWLKFGCACSWVAEKYHQNCRWFFNFLVLNRLFDKTKNAITAN